MYVKKNDDKYVVDHFEQVRDGSYYADDIRTICNGNKSLEDQFFASSDAMIIKTIDVNYSNYLLEFDESDCLNRIVLQVGGSRNGLYMLGMKLDDIKVVISCEIELEFRRE